MALSELTTRSSPAKIGFLGATSPTIWSRFVLTFEKELRTLGWTIGDDLLIDYQWAYGLQKNFKSIAEGFVSNEVDIIVTSSTGAAIEAQIAINSAENPEDFHV